MRLLVAQQRVDVNFPTGVDGLTGLAIAAIKGRTEIAKLLIASPNIDLNKQSVGSSSGIYDSKTPLTLALEYKREDIALLLLSAGAAFTPEQQAGLLGLTLLKAAERGDVDELRVAVERARGARGCDMLNYADESGHSAIHCAVLSDKFDAVRLLCATPGLQVNKKDKLGCTALGLAIKWKHGRIVSLLRTSGGVLEAEEERTLSGQQIYDACENGDISDLQALLAKWGGTSTSVNWTKSGLIVGGYTPLTIAIYYGKAGAAQLLMEASATDLNKTTSAGLTPLMLCAEYGRAPIARQLLHENSNGGGHHRGALRMDLVDNKGRTALAIAVQRTKEVYLDCGFSETVALLKGAGARA